MEDEKFIKGFNDGYLLSKYQPELLKKLLFAKNDHDYFDGLKEGQKEHEKEKLIEHLKSDKGKSKDKSQDKDLEI